MTISHLKTLKNDDYIIKTGGPPAAQPLAACGDTADTNDEFCIRNDEFCVQNDEFCIRNDEFCIQNDELCR